MQVLFVLLVAIAAANAGLLAPATTLVRTPSLDSAVIRSERLGGNFAYSSVEGHSYAAVSPVISHVPTPVAVSYAAHPIAAPAVIGAHHLIGAPAIYPGSAPVVVAA